MSTTYTADDNAAQLETDDDAETDRFGNPIRTPEPAVTPRDDASDTTKRSWWENRMNDRVAMYETLAGRVEADLDVFSANVNWVGTGGDGPVLRVYTQPNTDATMDDVTTFVEQESRGLVKEYTRYPRTNAEESDDGGIYLQ